MMTEEAEARYEHALLRAEAFRHALDVIGAAELEHNDTCRWFVYHARLELATMQRLN